MTETTQPLTAKQQAVLAYIRDNTQPASPTSREIAAAFGWSSPHSATVHLKALERKGKIRRKPGKARNIEVLP
jgi:repressor LexA